MSIKDHVSVCIPTFHRNKMLERLIKKLSVQETSDLFDFSIIIIDNDVAESARKIVQKLSNDLNIDIVYDIESEQTIPAARNHALRLAKGNFIGIIDDDEFPPRQWLATLYRAINTFDVDGALGPVYPYFETYPPAWLIKGKFCERPIHRTGTLLSWNQTRTGNVLLKKEVFDTFNLFFDPRFKTGGSDQDFFKKAMKAGYRFIAVEEAPVYETVPSERWTGAYYINRALINGYNSSKYNIHQRGINSLIFIIIKLVITLIIYMLLLPIFALLGKHMIISNLERAAYHWSRLCGIFGIELVKKRNF